LFALFESKLISSDDTPNTPTAAPVTNALDVELAYKSWPLLATPKPPATAHFGAPVFASVIENKGMFFS
jgi:hypothetical protein